MIDYILWKKIRVHVFICIFQLFRLIADISVWYRLKARSIPRLMLGRSYGYDYYERFRSWVNAIPPQSKNHKMSSVRSQCKDTIDCKPTSALGQRVLFLHTACS